MHTIRLLSGLLIAALAQAAGATTIWLKDDQGNVCKNSLSTNPGQVIGLGTVNNAGAFTLTISNPSNGIKTPSTGQCANVPAAPAANPLVFTGTVTPRIMPVHMWKAGTGGRMECLDQGNNFIGVSGVIANAPYQLQLSGGYTDGCDMQTQTKTTASGLPTFVRDVKIRQGERAIYSGTYYIFQENAQGNPIPEPGTLALLAMGATGLMAMALRRRTDRV